MKADESSSFSFESRLPRREVYDQVFTNVGFDDVTWHGLVVPPELEARDGADFWRPLLALRAIGVVECRKR